jgi:hypothetical protein
LGAEKAVLSADEIKQLDAIMPLAAGNRYHPRAMNALNG